MRVSSVFLTGIAITALAGVFAWVTLGNQEFKAVAAPAQGCPSNVFAKSARVFDAIQICATSATPDAKVIHAANVAAEWLDNDDDGITDQANVVAALSENGATLLMSTSGFTMLAARKVFDELGDNIGQDLAAFETAPESGERDASQEEIHHLIINAGWATAYPDVFADQKSSAIYSEWEKADAGSHYAYNDPTCDSACKTVEFFYLATAAYLGSSADLASDEMRLKTRSELANKLPGTIEVIESPAYVYPTNHWPSGSYANGAAIVYFGL